MSSPSREFHLIVDHLSAKRAKDADSAAPGEAPRAIVVPEGVSYLSALTDGTVHLATDAAGFAADEAIVIEPVVVRGRPHLVLVGQGNTKARVNGLAAPSFALLCQNDQVQINEDTVLHVTLFNRPRIGELPSEHVGKECPICRVPLVAGTRVYICAHCAAVLHFESDEKPEDTRLECAVAVSECPVCQQPIEMREGFSSTPELYSA